MVHDSMQTHGIHLKVEEMVDLQRSRNLFYDFNAFRIENVTFLKIF